MLPVKYPVLFFSQFHWLVLVGKLSFFFTILLVSFGGKVFILSVQFHWLVLVGKFSFFFTISLVSFGGKAFMCKFIG